MLALLLACAGCGSARLSGEQSYRRGLAELSRDQPRMARVDLLNAAAAIPGDARIHLALADAYLRLGDGVAGEAEVKRARALGAAEDSTRHLFAHALLLQDRPDRAVDEAEGPSRDPAYSARIAGLAAMALGDAPRAGRAFERALAAGPNDSRTWAGIARFRRWTGETAGAIAAADRSVGLDPRNFEALELRGELVRAQYGPRAALAWFDRALEVDPQYLPACIERAATLAELGRMTEMLAGTRRILSIAPKNPDAFFFQAILAARAGKYDLARSLYRRTGGALDGQPAALLLAGAIELESGTAEQGVKKLQQLVALQPDNFKARRLLGWGQLRLGDAAGAIATLKPVADRPDADPYTLSLIGSAYRRRNDAAAAVNYLVRAARPQRPPAAPPLGAPLGDEGLAALRSAAEAGQSDAPLQVQLIRALLARGLGPEALARARRLEADNPGAPDAHMLAGDALVAAGDLPAAAEAYRRAANIAFTEPVAMRLVHVLDISGDRAGAARVLSLFLQQNPENVPALTVAGNGFLAAGRWDRAILAFERVRTRIGNRDATLLNNLAWAWSQTGDYDRALPLAARAWSLDRADPATADTLGWLLYRSGRDRMRGLALLQQAARGAPAPPGKSRGSAAAPHS
jgi:tetratricopeptide (TPR) repeat protein